MGNDFQKFLTEVGAGWYGCGRRIKEGLNLLQYRTEFINGGI